MATLFYARHVLYWVLLTALKSATLIAGMLYQYVIFMSVFAFGMNPQEARSCLVQESQSSRTLRQKKTDFVSLALVMLAFGMDIRRD